MSTPSIFTKIINGELPSHKIYEDEHVFAFLDIYSAAPYHTLVIPKKQIEFVWDLENADYAALMEAVRMIAIRIRDVSGKAMVHSKIVGTDVPHAHVHLVPFDESRELEASDKSITEPDHDKLAAIASKLRIV